MHSNSDISGCVTASTPQTPSLAPEFHFPLSKAITFGECRNADTCKFEKRPQLWTSFGRSVNSAQLYEDSFHDMKRSRRAHLKAEGWQKIMNHSLISFFLPLSTAGSAMTRTIEAAARIIVDINFGFMVFPERLKNIILHLMRLRFRVVVVTAPDVKTS